VTSVDFTITTFLFWVLVLSSFFMLRYHIVSVMVSQWILSLFFRCCPLLELYYTITRFPEFIWLCYHDISFSCSCTIICFSVILSCCLYNDITLHVIIGFSSLSIIGIILHNHEIPWFHLILLSRHFFLGSCTIISFSVVLSCCLYNAMALYIIFGFSFLSIIGIILHYHEIPWVHLITLSRYFFFGLLYYHLFLCHAIMLSL